MNGDMGLPSLRKTHLSHLTGNSMCCQHPIGVNSVLFVLDCFYRKWKFPDTHSFRNNEYIAQGTLKDAGVNTA